MQESLRIKLFKLRKRWVALRRVCFYVCHTPVRRQRIFVLLRKSQNRLLIFYNRHMHFPDRNNIFNCRLTLDFRRVARDRVPLKTACYVYHQMERSDNISKTLLWLNRFFSLLQIHKKLG